MKYVSLFAGIGGFDLALNRLGHECVYVNEWDKYATQTYEKNFKHKPDTRDITTVPTSDIPEHDILVGGFPCQAFSIAGKRRGFDDTRGTLFFDIARILKDKRPRHFILENVKGLLNHDSGKTFQTILGVLSDLGYEYQWQLLNSKNFGVLQNRERVFIVGHIRGEPRPKVFPIAGSNEKATFGTITGSIGQARSSGSSYINEIQQVNKPKHSNDRVYTENGISPSLNTMGGGRRQPKVMRQPLKFLQRNQKNIAGDYSFTVDGANTGGVRQDMRIRRLTPLECERLQGFPDNWTEGVSDTQRYKQLGNAVTVNVVEEVARLLPQEPKGENPNK